MFTRRMLKFDGTKWPVLIHGRTAWVFVDDDQPVALPKFLLVAPRRLQSWLLRDHFGLGPQKTLGVTVIPHMACNLICGYCFQNAQYSQGQAVRVDNSRMNPETLKATVAFIERQRQALGCKDVSLALFGGEPLLNPDRCYQLLEQIQHVSDAAIWTNGVFLTAEVASELGQRGVTTVQVTFDGAQPDHDKLRMSVNKSGSYGRILKNLVELDGLPVLPKRKLRVNVTATNLPGIEALVHDLAAKLTAPKWELRLGIVNNNDIGWSDVINPTKVESRLIQLVKLAADCGFRAAPPPPGTGKCPYCSGQFGKGGIVVSADGSLASCWETAGVKDMRVGDVKNGYIDPAGHEDRWQQCDYRSVNQGPLTARTATLAEYHWTCRELVVRQLISK